MEIKYRSSPIEGYITDAAGNVLRNTIVRIKEEHPGGLVSDVESIKTDNNGYYISSPLRRGAYSLYDGGVRLSRKIHDPQSNFEIPAFIPNAKAAPEINVSAPQGQDVVEYIFLQIEPDDRDIDKYGHTFDIFDKNKYSGKTKAFIPFQNMPSQYFIDNNRMITNRRFDVYFSDESTGAFIMWCGIPAIVRDNVSGTQLVIPLDQYSLFPKRLKQTRDYTGGSTPAVVPNPALISDEPLDDLSISTSVLTLSASDADFTDNLKRFLSSVSVGDILMIDTVGSLAAADIIWARVILKNVTSTTFELKIEDWIGRPVTGYKKADYLFGSGAKSIEIGSIASKTDLNTIYIFDGMTKALDTKSTISPQSMRRRFYVFESEESSSMLSSLYAPFDNEKYGYELNVSEEPS